MYVITKHTIALRAPNSAIRLTRPLSTAHTLNLEHCSDDTQIQLRTRPCSPYCTKRTSTAAHERTHPIAVQNSGALSTVTQVCRVGEAQLSWALGARWLECDDLSLGARAGRVRSVGTHHQTSTGLIGAHGELIFSVPRAREPRRARRAACGEAMESLLIGFSQCV